MACRNLRERRIGTLAPSLRMQLNCIIYADAQTADLPTNQVGCKIFEIPRSWVLCRYLGLLASYFYWEAQPGSLVVGAASTYATA